jgi:hypothetical protein
LNQLTSQVKFDLNAIKTGTRVYKLAVFQSSFFQKRLLKPFGKSIKI